MVSILPEYVIDAELEVVCDGEDPRVVVQLRRALVPRQLGTCRYFGRQEAKLVPYTEHISQQSLKAHSTLA